MLLEKDLNSIRLIPVLFGVPKFAFLLSPCFVIKVSQSNSFMIPSHTDFTVTTSLSLSFNSFNFNLCPPFQAQLSHHFYGFCLLPQHSSILSLFLSLSLLLMYTYIKSQYIQNFLSKIQPLTEQASLLSPLQSDLQKSSVLIHSHQSTLLSRIIWFIGSELSDQVALKLQKLEITMHLCLIYLCHLEVQDYTELLLDYWINYSVKPQNTMLNKLNTHFLFNMVI